MTRGRTLVGVALLLVVGTAGACTPDPVAVAPSPGATSAAEPGAAAPTRPAVETTPLPNDLATNPLKRSFKSGGLTFNVEYTASAPVDTWTPDGAKALRVSLTTLDNDRPGQKIYLTRASVRFTVQNASGDLPAPDPIVDTANLSPGYLTTFPYSYDQSFAIPRLDDSATGVQMDFKYEVVSLVDKKSKDYTKQTATDTVRVGLDF